LSGRRLEERHFVQDILSSARLFYYEVPAVGLNQGWENFFDLQCALASEI